MSIAPEPTKNMFYKGKELTLEEKIEETKRERTILIGMAEEKLEEAHENALWSFRKYWAFAAAFFCSIIGVFMILFGLAMTVLFETRPKNFVIAGCGGVFFSPWLYYFFLMICPNKQEKERRKMLIQQYKVRKKPSLYNDLLQQAESQRKGEKPPPLILVRAVVRGSNGIPTRVFPYMATTLYSFCEFVEHDTGLVISQQKILYKGRELYDLSLHLEEDYKLKSNDELHVYNRGKYINDIIEKNDLRNKIMKLEDIEAMGGQETKATDKAASGDPAVLAAQTDVETGRKVSVRQSFKEEGKDSMPRLSNAGGKQPAAIGDNRSVISSQTNISKDTTKVMKRY